MSMKDAAPRWIAPTAVDGRDSATGMPQHNDRYCDDPPALGARARIFPQSGPEYSTPFLSTRRQSATRRADWAAMRATFPISSVAPDAARSLLLFGMQRASLMQRSAIIPSRFVYWHRDLPPLTAEVIGDDTIEATSGRVVAHLSHRDDAWVRCYADLVERARVRLEQEGRRRGADCVHVKDEVIEPRRDETSGETWLYGRFRYVLYRDSAA
jgi:hypothetical protein